MSEITWEQVSQKEEVTEDDIKNAESSGRPPVGKYICVVDSTKPKQVNPKDKESYFVASLKLKIEEVIELNGKPVEGEEGDQYIGRFIFDSVSLARDDEPDVFRNRRICIAKRAGIISGSSSEIPINTWSELILGKTFLIDYVEDTYYSEKKKKDVTITKVALFGYDVPENAVTVSDEDLEDI